MWIFFAFIHILPLGFDGEMPPSDVAIHSIHSIHIAKKSSIHKGLRGVGGLLFCISVLQYTYLPHAGASHAGAYEGIFYRTGEVL